MTVKWLITWMPKWKPTGYAANAAHTTQPLCIRPNSVEYSNRLNTVGKYSMIKCVIRTRENKARYDPTGYAVTLFLGGGRLRWHSPINPVHNWAFIEEWRGAVERPHPVFHPSAFFPLALKMVVFESEKCVNEGKVHWANEVKRSTYWPLDYI